MKKVFYIIALTLTASRLIAQDCSLFLFMQKNKVIEAATFDEKGVKMRRSVSTVTNVTVTNGITIGTVVAQAYDADGKPIGGKNNLTYKCNNGSLMVSMNPTGGGNVDITAGYLEYPPNMKVGDHLKDAAVDLTMPGGPGGKPITANEKITNRLVAAKESVTTPAGTWTALKITYKTVTTVGGNLMPPQTVLATEWYVPNFGIIKSQLYGMTIEITKIQ